MKAKIKFKGKEIVIEPIKKVSGLGMVRGLMFRSEDTGALLFEFSKGRHAIHSFFCKPFLAVWLNEGKIVDYKLISSRKASIKPSSDFDKLIEIPFSDRYKSIIELFLENGKQI